MTQDESWLLKEKYNGEKTEGFFADCVRLKNGEPLAYVIGHIPFLDTKIFLAPTEDETGVRPLIPRVETEYWVEKVIAEMQAREKRDLRVLDLCAGSGCIGIAVLTAIPNARVDFGEIDARLHPLIEKNVRENSIDTSRMHIYGGNLFETITGTYDYILSNPPYIDPVLNRTEQSVHTHEPHLALYGGKDGLELILNIIEHSHLHMCALSVLYIQQEQEQ